VRVWPATPLTGSQIRTVLSQPAEASQDPSGTTANTPSVLVWPVRVWRSAPLAGSQIHTFLSQLAEASQDPSGATATTATPRVLPAWGLRVVPVIEPKSAIPGGYDR
jgi:hypothetical protein